jgi:Flp pilus assembly pilin Flp
MWYSDIRNRKGQNLIEYTIIVAVVTSAVVAMSTYVFRSIQATQQMIQKDFSSAATEN